MMPQNILAKEKEFFLSLAGEWKFQLDTNKKGMDGKWYAAELNDRSWGVINVPSVWNSKETKEYDGIAWYRKKFFAPSLPEENRIALSFQAVDEECTVWLNGEKLGEHSGQNEPFYFDVTGKLKPESENIIAIMVNDWRGDGGIRKPVVLKTYEREEELRKGEFFDREALPSAEWIKDAVIYEVYLRSFSEDSKFHSLEMRLQELKNMGVTCLWLMPIHPVGEVKRKGSLGSPYSVKNYYGVNLEFGTKDSFKRLVQEAHLTGLKVIIDWVANHTAWDSPLIQSASHWYLKNEKGEIISPHEHWTDVAGLNYSAHPSPLPARQSSGGRGDKGVFPAKAGSAGEDGSPELRNYMKEAMLYWVKEFDIDGFRCDVADLLPVDFWEETRAELIKIKPNILMLAEGDRPENHLASFDLTYSWNLYDALVKNVEGKADATLIDETLKKEYYTYPRGSLRLRFSENQDKERARKIFGPAHAAVAVLIFTLDGVPLIYSGQEIGETHKPSLFEKEVIQWKENSKKNSEIKKFYKKLVKTRTGQPALTRGQRFRVKTTQDQQIFAFARSYRDDAVLVAINLSDKESKGAMEIPEIFWSEKGKLKLKPVFAGAALQTIQDGKAKFLFPPWGYQIWLWK